MPTTCSPSPRDTLSLEALESAFSSSVLFKGKTWQCSPEPWFLTEEQEDELKQIGQACLLFQKALELLYRHSIERKSLLRNKELYAPWVAEYYDKGKPRMLLDHAHAPVLKNTLPVVIRPDLLLTESGFVLTEIDSVPGGIGLTAFLNELYSASRSGVLQAEGGMVQAFYQVLAALVPEVPLPLIAFVVSEEADTYRPEFEWLAEKLRAEGKRVEAVSPEMLHASSEGLFLNEAGSSQRIDVVYRFFELFDLDNIACTEAVMRAAEAGQVVVTPPMRPFQEEKLSLALFHHHLLQSFWEEVLPKRTLALLKKIIPQSWILEPTDLPPSAVLSGPEVNGRHIHHWRDLAQASLKKRNWILKLSGFHEEAWGARSVTLGTNVSQEAWLAAIDEALESAAHSHYVLQDYHKPARLMHPVYNDSGEAQPQAGRVRICPYYFVEGGEASLSGVLATFCPADKKIIHGMIDAALIPCQLKNPQ